MCPKLWATLMRGEESRGTGIKRQGGKRESDKYIKKIEISKKKWR